MKPNIKIKHLVIVAILVSFSCEGELEDCYETVCTGPDNKNCREEPVFNSGCFPMDTGALKTEE